VQTGKDVLLEIMDPDAVKNYNLFVWRVKKTDNDPEPKFLVTFSPVDGPDVPENYTEIVFPQANFSVILKNLQKANSGLYDAQLSTSKQEILVAYNITVLVIATTMSVDPVSSSPDSCNVTVSCTTDDYTISSTWTCTNQTCSNQGHNSEITPLGASLHIYLSDDSVTIICNHSNQVDWITASAHISPLCPTSPGKAEALEESTQELTLLLLDLATFQSTLAALLFCFFQKATCNTFILFENFQQLLKSDSNTKTHTFSSK
uniref:Ig-like domain-containing protein n=1 Tax=Sphaeramia orbicularis TaxID=375764 RepID=A0A673A9Q8_9TELE